MRLELETLDYKVDQLSPIVEQLSRLRSREFETHLIDGKPTKTRFVLAGEPESYTWRGPTKINGHTFQQYEGKAHLDYKVVTLTWKLQFPEIPRAHVPTLRLAPRIGIYGRQEPHSEPFNVEPAPKLPMMPRGTVYRSSGYLRQMHRARGNGTEAKVTSAHDRKLWQRSRFMSQYVREAQKVQDDGMRLEARMRFLRAARPGFLHKSRARFEGTLLRFDE